MGVNNSLARANTMNEKVVEFQVNGEPVKLSASIVRNYLTNGNGNVSDQEVAYFINMCKYQKMNPLTKDCYLVKYGSQPAAIVTGKDALLKRAMRNPKYKGHEAGVIVRSMETRQLEYRPGSIVLPEEELVGGWAKTYVDGYNIPIEAAVSFREYVGTKGDGSMNSMWAGKPGTMIRKVALVASLREAFPDDLGGMYAAEEVQQPDGSPAIDDAPAMDIPVQQMEEVIMTDPPQFEMHHTEQMAMEVPEITPQEQIDNLTEF